MWLRETGIEYKEIKERRRESCNNQIQSHLGKKASNLQSVDWGDKCVIAFSRYLAIFFLLTLASFFSPSFRDQIGGNNENKMTHLTQIPLFEIIKLYSEVKWVENENKDDPWTRWLLLCNRSVFKMPLYSPLSSIWDLYLASYLYLSSPTSRCIYYDNLWWLERVNR